MQSSSFYVHRFFFARLSRLEADMNKIEEPEDDVHHPRKWNLEHINMTLQKGGEWSWIRCRHCSISLRHPVSSPFWQLCRCTQRLWHKQYFILKNRIFRIPYCNCPYTGLKLSHSITSLSMPQSIKHILNIIVPYFIPVSLMHTCAWTQSLQRSKCFTSRYFTCLSMSFYIPDYI